MFNWLFGRRKAEMDALKASGLAQVQSEQSTPAVAERAELHEKVLPDPLPVHRPAPLQDIEVAADAAAVVEPELPHAYVPKFESGVSVDEFADDGDALYEARLRQRPKYVETAIFADRKVKTLHNRRADTLLREAPDATELVPVPGMSAAVLSPSRVEAAEVVSIRANGNRVVAKLGDGLTQAYARDADGHYRIAGGRGSTSRRLVIGLEI